MMTMTWNMLILANLLVKVRDLFTREFWNLEYLEGLPIKISKLVTFQEKNVLNS